MNKRETLIVDNMGLVYHIIRQYYPTFANDDDVKQEGMIGLIKAVDTFDESKSKFSTYATRCILNELRYYFRREMKQPNSLSLDYEITQKDGSAAPFHELVMGEEDVNIFSLECEEFFKSLDDRKQKILELSLVHTEREIGEILGVSQPCVSRLKKEIKRRWREFNGEDID